MDRKVFSVQRETFLSSLAIGEDILTHMGVTKNSIKKKLKLFTDHDNSTIKMMKRQFDDNENYSLTFRQRQEDLKNLLSKEENQMKKKRRPKTKISTPKTWSSMKKLLAIFLLFFHVSVASDMKLIGQGTLKVLFFEVYDIRLLSDSNPFSWENKFQLEFEYRRTLTKERVIDSSLKELKRQQNVTEQNLNEWETYLEEAIQPLQEGSKATIEWNPQGTITFQNEGVKSVTIKDEIFARSYINIWLGEETSQPKLRNQLLGKEWKNLSLFSRMLLWSLK